MPLIIPEGFAEIALEIVAEGDPDPWYVTWGVAHTVDASDEEAIGGSANLAWGEHIQPLLPVFTRNTGCKVTVGPGPTPLRLFVPQTPEAQLGVGSDTRLPQNCSLLVRKNTSLGGRRNRGRFFVPSILGEGQVNGVGRIDSFNVADFQTYFDLFKASLADAGGPTAPSTPMVLLHHSEGESAPGSPTPVSSLTVDSTISTQRRRLR